MTEDDIRDYLVNSGKFIDPAKWIILMFKEIYEKGASDANYYASNEVWDD